MFKKLDTIDASTLLAIWVLFSDTTWLLFDIYHNGFSFGYGVVSIMFILGYIGLAYLYRKHRLALAKPTTLRKRVAKQSELILKHEQEIKALKEEINNES